MCLHSWLSRLRLLTVAGGPGLPAVLSLAPQPPAVRERPTPAPWAAPVPLQVQFRGSNPAPFLLSHAPQLEAGCAGLEKRQGAEEWERRGGQPALLARVIGAGNGAGPFRSRLFSRCFSDGSCGRLVSLGSPHPHPSPLTTLQESGQGDWVRDGLLGLERKFKDVMT